MAAATLLHNKPKIMNIENLLIHYSSEHSDEHNSSTVNLKKACFFKNLFRFSLRFGAVGETRTLTGKPTRPSSVPVYQFQHDRNNYATIKE